MPAVPATAPKTSENTLSSLALVDTLSLLDGRLRLTLGICHQFVKITNFNTSTGAVTESYDKSAVTPAVALVIKPWGQGISLYADYVQGLSKGATITYTTDAHSHTFAPYKTEQKEAGIKWNVVTFSNTVSLFEITKPMLISVHGNDALDDGEKRVRGLEWNVFGEVKRGIRLLGGAAYTQGVQTKTANGTYDGNAAVGAPRWRGNLGVEWDSPWLPVVTLNSRIITSSSQYLNGANLLDRHYYSGTFSDTTPIATLGQGRTISVTVDF